MELVIVIFAAALVAGILYFIFSRKIVEEDISHIIQDSRSPLQWDHSQTEVTVYSGTIAVEPAPDEPEPPAPTPKKPRTRKSAAAEPKARAVKPAAPTRTKKSGPVLLNEEPTPSSNSSFQTSSLYDPLPILATGAALAFSTGPAGDSAPSSVESSYSPAETSSQDTGGDYSSYTPSDSGPSSSSGGGD